MPDFGRYRVFAWDEFLRLWCEDCYTEGEELGIWPDNDPTDVSEIVDLIAAHELAAHGA